MCKENDIKIAVDIFRSSNCPFELMHCVSTYPMKIENANLQRIISLREKFKCDVGYSGHENALSVSYAAAMMGITSLERHITLDRTMYGSDQAASLEFRGMQELISVINRMLVASSGVGEINKILPEEIEIAKANLQTLSTTQQNKYFTHPIFGDLSVPKTLRFFTVHTNHHLKIIRAIK